MPFSWYLRVVALCASWCAVSWDIGSATVRRYRGIGGLSFCVFGVPFCTTFCFYFASQKLRPLVVFGVEGSHRVLSSFECCMYSLILVPLFASLRCIWGSIHFGFGTQFCEPITSQSRGDYVLSPWVLGREWMELGREGCAS
jgi:hypothetical protein